MMIDNIKIDVEGPFRFERIVPGEVDKLRKAWKEEFGISIPDKIGLKRLGRIKDLRVLLDPITITVTFSNNAWLQFKFHRGFITDLASVPSFFRGVVDNDDVGLLVAALCHDYLFSTHKLKFETTNDLFYQMARKRGYSRIKSRLAYWSVNSIFGRARWEKSRDKREWWTDLTAEFMESRKNSLATWDLWLRG